jgi:hypothetical protein
MKRKVIAMVIGAVGVVGLTTSSYGQGQVAFDTYSSTGYFPVTYSAQAQTLLGLSGPGAGQNVDAELGYFIGTADGSSVFTFLSQTITPLAPDSAPPDGIGTAITGYIRGGAVTGGIPGYTSGPISFEILAWVATGNGAGGGTFNTSGYNGTFEWTESSLPQVGPSAPATFFQSLTGNAVLNPTAPVPEPTTLALAGLGGLASLVALRRKKA